jgi:hypothetical protein
MKNVNCPHCGVLVQNEDHLAGQVIACPSCRNPFRLPDADADAHFEFGQQASPEQPASPPAPPRVSDQLSWYGLQATHVRAALWVGVVVLGLIAVVSIVILFGR